MVIGAFLHLIATLGLIGIFSLDDATIDVALAVPLILYVQVPNVHRLVSELGKVVCQDGRRRSIREQDELSFLRLHMRLDGFQHLPIMRKGIGGMTQYALEGLCIVIEVISDSRTTLRSFHDDNITVIPYFLQQVKLASATVTVVVLDVEARNLCIYVGSILGKEGAQVFAILANKVSPKISG